MDESTGQDVGLAEAPASSATTSEVSTPFETPAAVPAAATSQETAEQAPQEFDGLFDETEPAPEGAEQPADGALQQYLSQNPNISTPEQLAGAVQDAGLMWDVVKGTQPASALFDTLRTNNPEAWQKVMQGTAEYLEKVSGYKFVDPAQATPGQVQSPEQQRVAALEAKLAERETREQNFQLQQRVQQAQKQVASTIAAQLKGSFLEGQETYAMQLVGMKLQGREQEVMDAIARGDASLLDRTVKQVRHEERIRFNAIGKQIASQRKALANGLPKADGAGAPPEGKEGSGFDLSTREGRIKYGLASFGS